LRHFHSAPAETRAGSAGARAPATVKPKAGSATNDAPMSRAVV
jgi:hypothetical protein